ncbi:MAG: 50S ribosomal protein L22 [Candidatus Taylorbacteria bacterium RIFCSPLOWO2_02_FULL_43_11]|uniref:Large ribosomal subunit protein uL22 n=1 Tax=Candidatus Taylorbacteria bacterium RIFCSPHIGHO2_02_FULL_43_32b TaxID=1802306 RepID=A0A1G2MHB7_9BACT|nr:MAG: 50S ribosomal protein L22 [Candidatus Taylorbacteria bacterium RIFCSPHIGHO2_01_FULL_43_47]OHA23295.1 MAG: 50S ribosomal protein L22 [Candidatus Taylorbacteria bacterium RIFCSPHIGHO2_02_FULL_43_32b]OHA30163.1 MAG: 50S ribosomal protein L22 [Candidatus Taylorbacteria bacterium RIFCSPLOWO2_01_FULL_43_44]OHA36028.1 MAG: 50S ribosomal protein L22 [Candidatus Taylorbacteria bacterium RIFCSPLOWO2_02_FULL_43_11]
MKAFLKNYRQSPRKVRLVAGLIKGKKVSDAFLILRSTPKLATVAFDKLLKSAVSNAKNLGKDEKNLIVSHLQVDAGVTMKRMMPRARGSAYRIKKRTSQIVLELGDSQMQNAKIKIKNDNVKS